MAQFSSTNYLAPQFTWATAGNDQFRITDLQNLGQAVEAHDHTASFGLAVMRLGGGCAVGTTVINGAATLTFPTTSDTFVGKATTDTLTNKTLTTPIIKAATGGPYVRVYRAGAAQTIGNATHTALIFDTERWDTDSNWVVGNATRLTATTAGWYAMTGVYLWTGNATGIRQIEIRLNGATYIAASASPASATSTGSSVSTQWYMNATDYVELLVYQDSTVGLAGLVIGSDSNCEFMMARISG